MSFGEDYKAELEGLVQLCDDLGRREPALAPLLGRGADPSVSRLLEGLAFSFGRLARRLDDDMPEVIHPIVENLCPELLRPIPSATMIELTPSPKMVSRQTVPAGAMFGARMQDGTVCHFRGGDTREVSPWALRRVSAGRASSGGSAGLEEPSLTLSIELFAGTELSAALPDTLDLFLAHPGPVALEARAFLLRAATTVTVRSPETEGSVVLPGLAPVRTSRRGPGAGGSACPNHPMAEAFLALRDYFVFPQSFAFVAIEGLSAALALGPAVRTLEVEIGLSEPIPRALGFDPSNVRLHVVAARNVFRAPRTSLELEGATRRRLELDQALGDAEVYAVEGVALVSRGLRRTAIEPWEGLFELSDEGEREDHGVRYEVHRVPSVLGPWLDVGVSFTGKGREALLADKVAVEVDVLATNGARAAELPIGAVVVPSASSPSFVSFRNVTPVTRAAPAALAADRAWQFFRLAKANVVALSETETLAEVVAAANVPAQQKWPDAKPGAERFAPIVRVERRRAFSADEAGLHAVLLVHVTLDARRFAGPGDAGLFGEVLVPLLAAGAGPGEWVELVLTDLNGAPLARFEKEAGVRRGP